MPNYMFSLKLYSTRILKCFWERLKIFHEKSNNNNNNSLTSPDIFEKANFKQIFTLFISR